MILAQGAKWGPGLGTGDSPTQPFSARDRTLAALAFGAMATDSDWEMLSTSPTELPDCRFNSPPGVLASFGFIKVQRLIVPLGFTFAKA